MDSKPFRVIGNYQTAEERAEKAIKDAKDLLNSGEKLRNNPFIFRAHQPLLTQNKAFM